MPYTISFANDPHATTTVGQVQVVTQVDPNLDLRTFQLGDIQLGDIQIHIPAGRTSFQGDFDFTQSRGFILRVSAGLDETTRTVSWLFQAIDPNTGEVIQESTRGLLSPDNAQGAGSGFVSFEVEPQSGLATGTTISAQGHVQFNTSAPMDTALLTQVLDATPPTTTLTATPLAPGSPNYQVQWTAQDDPDGSGVQDVTVYVAEDGGDYQAWLDQTTETSAVYQGQPGHTYQFLALARDNAGNQEQPPPDVLGALIQSSANLGSLPTVPQSTAPDLPPPPPPSTQPSSNPLFLEAGKDVPSTPSPSRPSEFTTVLQPFEAESFATGITPSEAGIGPMALVALPDGSILASGGPTRGKLWHFDIEGGAAGMPLAELSEPIFDMALDPAGNLWATTGGGPLVQLDPATGQVINAFSDGLTQSLAIQPGTGLIYVSSGKGIEFFDPKADAFQHFSDVRVNSLAFAPDGSLWATTWPDRGDVIRFDLTKYQPGKNPQVMLQFDDDVDSIAFGQDGTSLAGLLFITHNEDAASRAAGGQPPLDSELTLVDLATMQSVAVATGGTRGGSILTTADGRVLICQSSQVDVLSPIVPPRVAATNPPSTAVAALPLQGISITFNRDMLDTDASDPHSVLNPANYQLTGDDTGPVPILGVTYDADSRTAVLTVDAMAPDHYTLQVLTGVQSSDGLDLAATYSTQFTAVGDISALTTYQFSDARSDLGNQTVSYDVAVTNITARPLLLPLVLELDPVQHYAGVPQGNLGVSDTGAWLIDLSQSLPGGVLAPGQSTAGQTITIQDYDALRVSYGYRVSAVPQPLAAPILDSSSPQVAVAGQPYRYAVAAEDPAGQALSYLLAMAPPGMTINPSTGLISWLPGAGSPARQQVVLQVYNAPGAPTSRRRSPSRSPAWTCRRPSTSCPSRSRARKASP